jgi:hypothetical protein
MTIPPPLNGTKTHPLSEHAYIALERLAAGPIPNGRINPSVANRLERSELATWMELPNPFKTTVAKHPTCPHLVATPEGIKVLAEYKRDGSHRLTLLGRVAHIRLQARTSGDMGRWFNSGMEDIARRIEAATFTGLAIDRQIDESQGRMYAQGQRQALQMLDEEDDNG